MLFAKAKIVIEVIALIFQGMVVNNTSAAPGSTLKLTKNWHSHRWSQIDKTSHQYNEA